MNTTIKQLSRFCYADTIPTYILYKPYTRSDMVRYISYIPVSIPLYNITKPARNKYYKIFCYSIMKFKFGRPLRNTIKHRMKVFDLDYDDSESNST